MDKFANLNTKERAEIFEETSSKTGLAIASVEKDFWVCWTLKQIFQEAALSRKLLFKGGTSLSKCFGLIERFSEDIDLILDWTELTDENPYAERSNTKQDRFNKVMDALAKDYIRDQMMPIVVQAVSGHCTVEHREDKSKSLFLAYPKAFDSRYIKAEVELEIGPMSSMQPSGLFAIRPYCGDIAPKLFEEPEFKVKAIEARKTFWDKVSILHAEAHRPDDKPQQPRYSRHYYDLYQMLNSSVVNEAMGDWKLLQDVVLFKAKFYPQGWANYESAIAGRFKLLPGAHVLKVLERDYAQMEEMIFGAYPSFDEIMTVIAEFENRLNEVSRRQ